MLTILLSLFCRRDIMTLNHSFSFHFVNVNESKEVEKLTNCNLNKNCIFKVEEKHLSSVKKALPLHPKRFRDELYIY